MTKNEFLEETKHYFEGGFSVGISQDASDGAWFQMHIDSADYLLNLVENDLGISIPNNVNAHDIVMYFLDDVKTENWETVLNFKEGDTRNTVKTKRLKEILNPNTTLTRKREIEKA